MIRLSRWKGAVVALLGLLLSFTGARAAQATLDPEQSPTPQPIAQSPAQACPETWQERQPYARVMTQRDPLRIRATPNGRVIGSVPKGWAVVVLERDSTGQWTKITSHFGGPGPFDMASAPNFTEGWVSTRFLQNLGEFCEKPMAMGATQLVASAQAQTYLAHEDWLQLGDRIAQAHRQE